MLRKRKIQPLVCPGGTDARHVRLVSYWTQIVLYLLMRNNLPLCQAGVPAIGFSPMNNTPRLIHDHDEHLSADTFLSGIEIYRKLISELANVWNLNCGNCNSFLCYRSFCNKCCINRTLCIEFAENRTKIIIFKSKLFYYVIYMVEYEYKPTSEQYHRHDFFSNYFCSLLVFVHTVAGCSIPCPPAVVFSHVTHCPIVSEQQWNDNRNRIRFVLASHVNNYIWPVIIPGFRSNTQHWTIDGTSDIGHGQSDIMMTGIDKKLFHWQPY